MVNTPQGDGVTLRKENQSRHREDESERKAKCDPDVLRDRNEIWSQVTGKGMRDPNYLTGFYESFRSMELYNFKGN